MKFSVVAMEVDDGTKGSLLFNTVLIIILSIPIEYEANIKIKDVGFAMALKNIPLLIQTIKKLDSNHRCQRIIERLEEILAIKEPAHVLRAQDIAEINHISLEDEAAHRDFNNALVKITTDEKISPENFQIIRDHTNSGSVISEKFSECALKVINLFRTNYLDEKDDILSNKMVSAEHIVMIEDCISALRSFYYSCRATTNLIPSAINLSELTKSVKSAMANLERDLLEHSDFSDFREAAAINSEYLPLEPQYENIYKEILLTFQATTRFIDKRCRFEGSLFSNLSLVCTVLGGEFTYQKQDLEFHTGSNFNEDKGDFSEDDGQCYGATKCWLYGEFDEKSYPLFNNLRFQELQVQTLLSIFKNDFGRFFTEHPLRLQGMDPVKITAASLTNEADKANYMITIHPSLITSVRTRNPSGHACAVKKTPAGNYQFYDPNHGFFKFKSREAFSRWLEYYLSLMQIDPPHYSAYMSIRYERKYAVCETPRDDHASICNADLLFNLQKQLLTRVIKNLGGDYNQGHVATYLRAVIALSKDTSAVEEYLQKLLEENKFDHLFSVKSLIRPTINAQHFNPYSQF